MGFFSDVLKIGGVLAAIPTGGASLIATGVGFSLDASEKQAEALERAGRVTEAAQLRAQILQEKQFDLAEKLIAEGADEREALKQAKLQLIPQLQRFASGEGGDKFASELTRKSFENIARETGPFGLDRSFTAKAFGEAASNIGLGLFDRRLNVAQALTGRDTRSLQSGLDVNRGVVSLEGVNANLSGALAQIRSQSPKAGLFSDLAGLTTQLGVAGLFKNTFSSVPPVKNTLGAPGSPSKVPHFNLG